MLYYDSPVAELVEVKGIAPLGFFGMFNCRYKERKPI